MARITRNAADLPSDVQARLAAEAAAEADRSDLRSQYAATVTRLTDIVNNGMSFTAVQTRDAVVDLARTARAILRMIRRLA